MRHTDNLAGLECGKGVIMGFLQETFGLTGKTAVITGGGGTLCGAIAEGYLKAGAKVILWGIHRSSLESKIGEMIRKGLDRNAIGMAEADLLQEAMVDRALQESIERFGPVDLLVNGVGGSSKRCPLTEMQQEDFEHDLHLNLLAGCVTPTKLLAKYWTDHSIRGAVINLASMGSFVPLSGAWAYSAAKAAVVNQTMAHAKELAPHGIRVNAIAPGFFLGKQNRRLLIDDSGEPTKRGRDVLAHTPMGRFGVPEDLVAAAVFLASDGSRFISGVALPVDGAYLCHNI